MKDSNIQIQVLLFGACRESANIDNVACELSAPATVADAWAVLKEKHPALSLYERNALFAVNEEHALRTQALRTGDTLAVFPPVSGG